MSMAPLLTASRNILRTELELDDNACLVLRKPPDSAGELFIGVEEGNVSNTERESIREEFVVRVKIWRRTGLYSDDRIDGISLEGITGLDAIEREIIKAIHGSYPLMAAANILLEAGDKFQQPLWYQGRQPSQAETTGVNDNINTWQTRTLDFRGALRVQSFANLA